MNVLEKFGRILIPMSTAFTEDYEINYQETRKIARFLISNNYCDSLILAGTNGEFYSMNYEEKMRLFREIKEEVGNAVPLIAGTGSSNTKETIALTKEAEKMGFDAAMVIVPYFCKPTQDGIKYHFTEVAKNASLPIMVYNIPLFTASNVEPETMKDLAKIDNIVAIKDEAGLNPLQTSAYLRATNDGLTVFSGDDLMVLSVLSQGGVGVVSGGSHIIGDLMRKMLDCYLSGNAEEATSRFKKLYNLFTAFFGRNGRFQNPLPGVKMAFSIHSGLDVSRVRPPLAGLDEDEVETIRKALKAIGKA